MSDKQTAIQFLNDQDYDFEDQLLTVKLLENHGFYNVAGMLADLDADEYHDFVVNQLDNE